MADPMGAAMYNYYSSGVLESSGTSISEGIGQGRVTANLESWGVPARDGGAVDFWCQVTDEEALPLIFDLLKQEGFCMGGSTAINIGGKCLDLFIMVAPSGFPNLVWQNIVFSQHVCNNKMTSTEV
jgi:cysteine synthase